MSGNLLMAVVREIAGLRGLATADAAPIVAGMLDDLAQLADDDRVSDETVLSLITQATRAIRPRAARADGPHAALDALRQAVAEGPRSPGRPAAGLGPAITVRLRQDDHDSLDDVHPVASEAVRILVAEALQARREDAR